MRSLGALCLILGGCLPALAAPAARPAAVVPAGTPTAEVCPLALGDLGRVTPVPSDRETRLRQVHSTLVVMKDLIPPPGTTPIVSKPKKSKVPAPDHVDWRYDSTTKGHTRTDNDPGALWSRLDLLDKFVTSGAPQSHFFQIEDPASIREFLSTGNPVRDPKVIEAERQAAHKKYEEAVKQWQREKYELEQKHDRAREAWRRKVDPFKFACFYGVGITGLVAGGYHAFVNNPNAALDQEMVDRAKATVISTRERHLQLVKEAISKRYDKDEILKQHIAYLDAMEKAGHPPQYGARMQAYLDYGGFATLDDLKDLATRKHLAPSANAFKDDATSGAPFTDQELDERSIRASRPDARNLYEGFLQAGVGAVGGISLGAFTCLRLDRFGDRPVKMRPMPQEPVPVPAPDKPPSGELDDLRKIADSVMSPDFQTRQRSPREIIWLGSDGRRSGKRRDLIMQIDNTVYPPRVTITGIESPGPKPTEAAAQPDGLVTPPQPQQPQAEKPPVKLPGPEFELNDIRERLLNVHGSQPLVELFQKINNLTLSQRELRQLKEETDRLIPMKEITRQDYKNLERLILDMEYRRRKPTSIFPEPPPPAPEQKPAAKPNAAKRSARPSPSA